MSAIIVLTPALIAAWPTITATVVGAATALGFAQASGAQTQAAVTSDRTVDLKLCGSAGVTDQLANDEQLQFVRDDVTVTFSRDARGRCNVSVGGPGMSDEALRQIGTEFAEQVVQQYAYHQLMSQLDAKGFNVVHQEVGDDQTIHIQVRRHE